MNEEEKKHVARVVMQRVALFIEGRKFEPGRSCLTEQAAGGFNLACDFLAHELKRLASVDNEAFIDA
jgi:hypothetical protein